MITITTKEIISAGSERGVLGLCLKNADKIIDCEDAGLFAEHFGIEVHKYIFLSISYLFSKGITPTPVALYEVLPDEKSKKLLDEFGGLGYLTQLSEIRVPEGSLKIFINKIKQAYTRREIISICEDTKEEMSGDDANVLNPDELVGLLERKITSLTSTQTNTVEIYKFGEKTEEVLKARAEKPAMVPGLKTGWEQFDKKTNGGQSGDLIFVSARSKTGKSATLLNWAVKMGVIDKMPILYIDTEMDERQQEDRILANLSGVLHSEIVSGMYVLDTPSGLAKDKIAALNEARKMLIDGNLYHIYLPQFSVERIASITKKFKKQHGIKALFFDYLKFPVNQMGNLKSMQEWQMLGFLASGLKDLAGLLQIPIYSAVQENRGSGPENKKSYMNVAGSDRILQLATKLIFLYNKTEEEIARYGEINGNQWLYIAYQRNGESDCTPISIRFRKEILKQEEA